MNIKLNKLNVFLTLLVVMLISVTPYVNARSINEPYQISNIKNYPKNSIERYAYSKAIQNKTSYEYELEKEKNTKILLGRDEFVMYMDKSGTTNSIDTTSGQLYPEIHTEAKVVVSKRTGRVVEVIDFGQPYLEISSYEVTWTGGGFNINRTSLTSARFSTTGQFTINNGDFTVGLDIISVTVHFGAKTKTKTYSTNISW